MASRPAWALLTAAVVASIMAATAALYPVTVLELENAARGHVFRFWIGRGEIFSVTYHHSIYDQPVTEEFTALKDGRIALTGLSSSSAAVREYFGIYASGEHHDMNRVMSQTVFRVAMGAPQRLRLKHADHSFLDFGDYGDRLVMRTTRTPFGAYLMMRLCINFKKMPATGS